MTIRISILLFLASTIPVDAQPITNVDVCVYGGTSAGVIAAYTIKKSGRSVLLIEPGKHLGGLSSGGLGYTDIGNKYAVTGLARDFYRRVGSHYGKFEQWIFEPHVAEQIFQEYIKAANVQVWYNRQLLQTKKTDSGFIEEILLGNLISPGLSKNRLVRAKIFIDCTYEGDLMAQAGVNFIVGREGNTHFKETYNGVQVRDTHQFPDGIDPYKIPGKPESGLVWGISPEKLPPPGTGDKKVQAYNFRICLSDDPANKIEITPPEDYDSMRYELLVRLMQKDPARPFNLILKPDLMPNHKTDINNYGPFSTDMIGMNYDYPEASYNERIEIAKKHELYIKGLLYFIGHSGRLPGHLRNEMLRWGYPKDEYTDNGNWSPQMYVREARRMISSYVMTQANCEGRTRAEDGVGMAAYTMDSHNTSRVVMNGMVKNEGDVQVGGFPPYPISYRSIVPRETECKNLLVPVCLSASHIAYGSIRMEPVFMVLAQSSAFAAIQAFDKRISVQEIDINELQGRIKNDPLADGSVPEVLVDNDDKSLLSIAGEWTTQTDTDGSYGPSFLVAESGKPASVKFSPVIRQAGQYRIYLYFPRLANASANISTVVVSGKKYKKEITIHPNDIRIEGQTSGEWVSLGSHVLLAGKGNYVEITTTGASGIVIADAALFIAD